MSQMTLEDTENYEVHCGQCGWWGKKEQLKAMFKLLPDKGVTSESGCPMCLSDQWLEYNDRDNN